MTPGNQQTESVPVILAIETSGQCGSVALVSPGRTIAEFSLDTRSTHSKRLLASIRWIMAEADLDWPEITAVAVSLGPGSFTGLRIGLSTAKGLVMAADKPLIGVSTLDALAGQLSFAEKLICPVIDARKQEVYTALYRNSSHGQTCIGPARSIKPAQLAAEISEPTVFIGDGLVVYGAMLQEMLGDWALLAPPELFHARAASIGLHALEKWQRNECLESASAAPIYIRKSDAELSFGKKKKLAS